jgi:hypothetical protein
MKVKAKKFPLVPNKVKIYSEIECLHGPVETANKSQCFLFQLTDVIHILLVNWFENFHKGSSVPSFLYESDSSS